MSFFVPITAFLRNCHVRWYEATDRWTHADDARTPTHDASSSTNDDASQARHDATRQIRASGFPPLFVAINRLVKHFDLLAEIVSTFTVLMWILNPYVFALF